MPSYLVSPDGKSITCLECGAISWYPLDVQQRYCEPCGRFHDDERAVRVDGRLRQWG